MNRQKTIDTKITGTSGKNSSTISSEEVKAGVVRAIMYKWFGDDARCLSGERIPWSEVQVQKNTNEGGIYNPSWNKVNWD